MPHYIIVYLRHLTDGPLETKYVRTHEEFNIFLVPYLKKGYQNWFKNRPVTPLDVQVHDANEEYWKMFAEKLPALCYYTAVFSAYTAFFFRHAEQAPIEIIYLNQEDVSVFTAFRLPGYRSWLNAIINSPFIPPIVDSGEFNYEKNMGDLPPKSFYGWTFHGYTLTSIRHREGEPLEKKYFRNNEENRVYTDHLIDLGYRNWYLVSRNGTFPHQKDPAEKEALLQASNLLPKSYKVVPLKGYLAIFICHEKGNIETRYLKEKKDLEIFDPFDIKNWKDYKQHGFSTWFSSFF